MLRVTKEITSGIHSCLDKFDGRNGEGCCHYYEKRTDSDRWKDAGSPEDDTKSDHYGHCSIAAPIKKRKYAWSVNGRQMNAVEMPADNSHKDETKENNPNEDTHGKKLCIAAEKEYSPDKQYQRRDTPRDAAKPQKRAFGYRRLICRKKILHCYNIPLRLRMNHSNPSSRIIIPSMYFQFHTSSSVVVCTSREVREGLAAISAAKDSNEAGV